MLNTLTKLGLLILMGIMTGAPSTSYANDDAQAKQLYEEGVTYYEAGRNQEAVVAWTQAYNLSKKPLLLFNIANAHERLGNLMEAYLTRVMPWS